MNETICQDCGAPLPYDCITPLCDVCLGKPAPGRPVPTEESVSAKQEVVRRQGEAEEDAYGR